MPILQKSLEKYVAKDESSNDPPIQQMNNMVSATAYISNNKHGRPERSPDRTEDTEDLMKLADEVEKDSQAVAECSLLLP